MLAAAAISMTASPVLAASPAAKLSVASARASAKEGESKLAGTGLIIALVVAAVVAIVVIADDSNSP